MNGIEKLAAPKTPDPHVALRGLAIEMEGVFYKQLFDAMRKSVPDGGLIESSYAQDVFTSMLDEKVAAAAAERARHGLSEALYRQLSRHLDGMGGSPAAVEPAKPGESAVPAAGACSALSPDPATQLLLLAPAAPIAVMPRDDAGARSR
jgi:flagellar protein FlgJ